MDESEISDVILTTDVDDHELSFPKLLVIWDLVVISLTFTDFEDGSITLKVDFNILELFGIDRLKLEFKFLLWDDVRLQEGLSLLKDTWSVNIFSRHVLKRQVSEDSICLEVL